MATLDNVVDEGVALCDRASERDITLRLLGGVAVWVHSPGARDMLSERTFGDIDLVGLSTESPQIEGFFQEQGYEPNWTFNRLHKDDGRMMFMDTARSRRVDVFLDRFSMCHSLDLSRRLPLDSPTLPVADLLLTKLQVVHMTEKDLVDISALLVDHAVETGADNSIDADRICDICSQDWGWFKTVETNLERLRDSSNQAAATRAGEILDLMRAAPKNLSWRMRAMVGERVQWYSLPEEV